MGHRVWNARRGCGEVMLKTGLLNAVLRSLTLGSKFLLLLVLARMFSPEQLGIYGLMVVTVTVSLYLLGFDFHAYNTREILARPRADWPARIRDQFVFHLCIYVAVLPLLLVIFATDTLGWSYAGWFYLLLVLEHASQEFYRLLITLSRSSLANTVLFLRSGVWVFAVTAIALFNPQRLSLEFVFGAWATGVALSVVLALVVLRDLEWRAGLASPVDWQWIRRGARVSLRFFAATVCLLGVQFADRYFLKHYHGEAAVGIYTFFWQIANTVQIFVYTAVATVIYPRLVESYQQGEMFRYRRHMRRLALGIIAITAIATLAITVFIRPVLGLVGREIYHDHLTVGWILLASMVLLSLSYVPNVALYVRRSDRAILYSSAVTLSVALVSHLLFIPRFGPLGAAWGTLAAAGMLLGSKAFFALLSRSRERREEAARTVAGEGAAGAGLTLRRGAESKEYAGA